MVFWPFSSFMRYFGHFIGFKGISKNFKVSGSFQSFLRFYEYCGHFLCLRCITVDF